MSKLHQVMFDVGQKVSYKKAVFTSLEGSYEYSHDEIKEGYIFCIMITENSISYKVHPNRTGMKAGWEEVVQSRIIQKKGEV